MVHLDAASPTDYQRQFYKAIGLEPVPPNAPGPQTSWELWENPAVGFVHGFGSMDTVHCGIGSYTIPCDLTVRYGYEFSYLHFGVIYRGVTYTLSNGQELAGPSPSAFITIERSPVGTNRWKAGQQARGTEISLCTDFLATRLYPMLGLSPACLDVLEVNHRYTAVPEDLCRTIKLFEDNLVSHRMTEALAVGLSCAFVAQLVQPNTLEHLMRNEGTPVERLALGARTLTLTSDELERIKQARKLIAQTATTFPSAASLAREVGLSEQKLKAGFSHLYHRTLGDFAHSVRMEEAGRLLRTTPLPVNQVSQMVGYQSEGAFIAAFKRWSGATPLRYRRREASSSGT